MLCFFQGKISKSFGKIPKLGIPVSPFYVTSKSLARPSVWKRKYRFLQTSDCGPPELICNSSAFCAMFSNFVTIFSYPTTIPDLFICLFCGFLSTYKWVVSITYLQINHSVLRWYFIFVLCSIFSEQSIFHGSYKGGTTNCSKISPPSYKTTRLHAPEDRDLKVHCCEKLKFHNNYWSDVKEGSLSMWSASSGFRTNITEESS